MITSSINSSIIKTINQILIEIIRENKKTCKDNKYDIAMNISFYSRKIPSIPIINYLERLIKYSKIEDSTVILMLCYIDLLCEINGFLLLENNIHR
jgi:hypothetical protein